MPGQEFYVKFDGGPDEQIDKLHIDFQWMEAEATLTEYFAKKYKNVYSCTDTESEQKTEWVTGSNGIKEEHHIQNGSVK